MSSSERVERLEADRREALRDPDSTFDAQLYFDVERGYSVTISKGDGWGLTGPDGDSRKWKIRDARSDEWIGTITHGTKKARMHAGGRYVNLDDVPESVRVRKTRTGLCPTCKREEATDEPEREMTLYVSPDETDGWAECDQGRGHRHPISEVLVRVA